MSDQKVGAMIVGAQKCGTTTLSSGVLASHPRLSKYRGGESHFFSTCENWKIELKKYHSKFVFEDEKICFEKSTTYTFYPHRNLQIWEDIREYNENMKIIYMVRDPVDRIRSAYTHSYERGYIDVGIEEALSQRSTFMDVTRYASQIRPFIRCFGRDQVLLLFLEDLRERPSSVIEQLADFLGVDADGFRQKPAEVQANQSGDGGRPHHRYDNPGLFLRGLQKFVPPLYERITDNSDRALDEKPSLPRKLERGIRYMLRAEIDEIEALTGRDLDHWRHEDQQMVSADAR
jgi:hypothetical protein